MHWNWLLLMLLVAEQWGHQLQDSLVELRVQLMQLLHLIPLLLLLLLLQLLMQLLVELELEVACAGHWSWS